MGIPCNVLLVIFILLVPLCYSQRCTGRCSAPLTTCNFITHDLYTQSSTNINNIENQAAQIIAQIGAQDHISASCKSFFARFVCSISYSSCNASLPNPPANRPCLQLCNDFHTQCGEYNITLPGALAPYTNCAATDADNIPLYSTNSVTPTPSVCHTIANTNPYKCLAASRCVKWNATAAPLSGEMCSPFIGNTIYAVAPISILDTNAYNAAIQYIKPYFPLLPLGCYKSLMAFVCGNIFSPCNEIFVPEFNLTTSVAVKPCRSICDSRSELCDEMLGLLKIDLAGCDDVAEGPVVKTNVTTTDRAKRTITLDNYCRKEIFPVGAAAYSPPPFEKCPSVLAPLDNPSEEKNDPRCWLKCPDASYSEDEWKNLVVLTQVGASLSFVTMTFLLVSYLVQHEKRKFPVNLHIWEFVSCMFLSFSFFLNGLNPQQNVWCNDPATFATQSNNSRCGAQGFLFIMFGLSVATWCCVIAFIMFRAILLSVKITTMAHLVKYFHLFAWGVPLTFAVAALASNSIGYGVPLAWCFIQFSGFGFGSTYDTGISVDYFVFYIPIGILFVLITTMFCITTYKIYVVRKLQIQRTGDTKRGSRTLLAQVRLLVFIFAVFIICFTIFEWRFQIEAENNRHHFDEVGIDWIACKIKTEIDNTTKFEIGNCPGEVPPARINYAHTQAESFLISAIGFFMFFGFGSDFGIYRHWRKIFILARRGEPGSVKALILYGIDPFSSSGTRSKSDSNSNSGTSKSKTSKNSKNAKSSQQRNTDNDNSGANDSSQFTSTEEEDTSAVNNVSKMSRVSVEVFLA